MLLWLRNRIRNVANRGLDYYRGQAFAYIGAAIFFSKISNESLSESLLVVLAAIFFIIGALFLIAPFWSLPRFFAEQLDGIFAFSMFLVSIVLLVYELKDTNSEFVRWVILITPLIILIQDIYFTYTKLNATTRQIGVIPTAIKSFKSFSFIFICASIMITEFRVTGIGESVYWSIAALITFSVALILEKN